MLESGWWHGKRLHSSQRLHGLCFGIRKVFTFRNRTRLSWIHSLKHNRDRLNPQQVQSITVQWKNPQESLHIFKSAFADRWQVLRHNPHYETSYGLRTTICIAKAGENALTKVPDCLRIKYLFIQRGNKIVCTS